MQPGLDRSDRPIECVGDFFVRLALLVEQHEHRAILDSQVGERGPNFREQLDGIVRHRAGQRLFAMHWERSGVRYGIGMEINYWLAIGLRVVVEGSRAYLPQALAAYPEMTVLWLGNGVDESAPRIVPEFRPDRRQACAPDERLRPAGPVIYFDCNGAAPSIIW